MDILQYENYHEREITADPDFPYQTYLCSIPLDFTCVPLHWHEEIEFIYIKKGIGLIAVDFVSFEVRQGDIVMVLPGHLHTISQSGEAAMEYENIIFKLSLLLSRQNDACMDNFLLPLLRHQISFPVHFVPGAPGYAPMAACLDAIDAIRETFPPAYELFIKGKLFELFYGLFAVCAETAQPHAYNKNQMDKTRQILKYIEQHYAEQLSVEDMAGVAGFSESHFMKFFKASLGISFTSYLNDYRLTMASRLLLSSDAPVLTVATDTGFQNLSYFNRVFKRKFGVTPSGFRNSR